MTTNTPNTKNRDISIDILKFFAVIFITNSHMELLYGKYSALATGGAIGDALFFFCSGYTLFLGRNASFPNWYKRRINRIFPTIFAWSLLKTLFWGNTNNIVQIITQGGGWFINCILIYYVILWFVKRYFLQHLNWVFIATILATMTWYGVFGITDAGDNNMYGATYFKWVHFFLSMLLGSYMGWKNTKRDATPKDASKAWKELLVYTTLFVFSVIAFYACCWFKYKPGLVWCDLIQISSLIPLAGACWSLWKVCNTAFFSSIYHNKYLGTCIRFSGGLCLEIYFMQGYFFTTSLNHLFPLNILLVFIGLHLPAYLTRCLARLIKQTFNDSEYNWKEIIKAF